MEIPASPRLSESQLATLGQIGEERTAGMGDVLFRVGDQSYPFIAIVEGEVAILDAAGTEVIRHGASGFAGEMNLLSGQTVFLTAVVTRELRCIAVEREALRSLLFEDGPLSDLLLSTFIARRCRACMGAGSRSSGRVHPRPHCGSSSSRGAIASRLPGATRSRRMMRRRPCWSRDWIPQTSRSCGC